MSRNIEARIKWLTATYERRMRTMVEGRLVIVDTNGDFHDFGKATMLRWERNRVVGIWEISPGCDTRCAHMFIEGKSERICNRPLDVVLLAGFISIVKAEIGASRGGAENGYTSQAG